MTEVEKNEVRGWIGNLRNEVYRQMGQFERDKVRAEDARAWGAIVSFSQDMAEVVSDGTALEGSK